LGLEDLKPMANTVKTERKPLITVGMPTKNNAPTITAVLESIYAQDYPKKRIQIVFVDGMSNDGTRQRISRWIKKKGQEYFDVSLESENSNIPKARNRCLKEAKGQLVLFWDADVVAPSGAMRGLLPHLRNRNVVIANHTYDPERPGFIDKVLELEEPVKITYVKSVVMGFTMIKKSIIKNVGYFNERLDAFEDQEFCRRVAKTKFKMVMDPTLRLKHLRKGYGFRQYVRDNFSRRSKYVNALISEGSRRQALRAVYYFLMPLNFLAGAIVAQIISWRIGFCILELAFTYMMLSVIWHFRKVKRSPYGLLSPLVHLVGGIALSYGMLWQASKEK
jgi:glycosyltransferase involved in cell wall biosynthesis